ncbi:hypothetical protein AOLI_G00041460 [Acnodon oligacanthus]
MVKFAPVLKVCFQLELTEAWSSERCDGNPKLALVQDGIRGHVPGDAGLPMSLSVLVSERSAPFVPTNSITYYFYSFFVPREM